MDQYFASDADSEISLLLTNIDSAMRALAAARKRNDAAHLVHCLESALHTYGSVKHLLPKLSLSADQRVPVQTQLSALRAAIIDAEQLSR
jgi:hypothetical protein